jgi:GrpB-like predicted nucleotidyltransferase (UPF0157 family)
MEHPRTLRPGSAFINEARAILGAERARLAGLLDEFELVLVGGSSLPGALTKGDVDLHLRVPAGSFGRTVDVLRGIHQVVHPEIWQATLATFAVRAALPTGIAVTPVGSEHDVRFARSWRLLAADPGLVAAYNAMKLRYAGDDGEYERHKSAFFDMLSARPDRSG